MGEKKSSANYFASLMLIQNVIHLTKDLFPVNFIVTVKA